MTTDLIKQLEEATGPDRELDYHLHCHANPSAPWMLTKDGYLSELTPSGEHYRYIDSPWYTDSVDAALTLVPEGFCLYRIQYHDQSDDWGVYIIKLPNIDDQWLGEHPSLPLAICIAALRAMEVENG